jgi:shikimate kinase
MALIKYPIYLIGMPGSGKTAVGKLLSDQLDLAYIDLDQYIVHAEKMSIVEIFETYGEAYFRALETKYLKMFQHVQGVISTGGGIVLNPIHMDIMKQGFIIYLETPLDLIKKRIEQNKERPSDIIEHIDQLYETRKPLYDACHDLKISNVKALKEVTQEIIKYLGDKDGNSNYTWS